MQSFEDDSISRRRSAKRSGTLWDEVIDVDPSSTQGDEKDQSKYRINKIHQINDNCKILIKMNVERSYIKEIDILFEIMKDGNNEEVIRWYDDNAAMYDAQFKSCGFIYHRTTAETVFEVAPDKSAVILDVGAGSGVIGELLRGHGYSTTDAIDASEGMLKIAEQKNIYRSIICAKIGTEPIQNLEGRIYDVLVSAALFAPGTVYYESIPLLMSYLTPGGHFIFSIADINRRVCPQLSTEKFMIMTRDWEHDNLCRFISEKKTYHINKEPASVIVLQKM